jgi:hypothetical protein
MGSKNKSVTPTVARWIGGGLPVVALQALLLLIRWDKKLKASPPPLLIGLMEVYL